MLLKEQNTKGEVLVWTHKGHSSIAKTCYYTQIKTSDESCQQQQQQQQQ